MFGGRWDCVSCLNGQRRQSYVCHKRGGTVGQALQRLTEAEDHPNLLAKYDYGGVCPKTMMQAVPLEFLQSIPWYDKGALGVPFHRVPNWYRDCMGIFETARARAQDAKMMEAR